MSVLLSRLFRFGTPVLAVLVFLHVSSWWWLVLVPVIPVWWSFVSGIGEARARTRIIRRPNRGMCLEESAIEQRFLRADKAFIEAGATRDSALEELVAARHRGAAKAASHRWRQGS